MPQSTYEQIDPDQRFDLAILGGGSAAFAGALRAAERGAQVLLVNEGTPGGTCVNVGCIPSKTLIRAAESAHHGRHSRFAGIKPEGVRIDMSELMREKTELVASLRQAKYADVVAHNERIQVLEGRARLSARGEIDVAGTRYHAEKLLVATGSRPARPAITGLEETGVWDSTQALESTTIPRELIVLGGRYIGLELGQMFARLGSQVTLVQRSTQILPDEDSDVAEALAELLHTEGIKLCVDQQVERIRQDGKRYIVEIRHARGTDSISGDAVLAALGRVPNSEGLEGVDLDLHGFVRVAEDLQTSQPDVYAAGDVIGDPMYVYAAAYEGAHAVENALGGGTAPRDYKAIPWVIFTDPQLAGVGLNEKEAQATGLQVDVVRLALTKVPRALAAHDSRGFIKLLRVRGEDRLVGARILAPEGGEQIMEASLMIRFGLPVSAVAHHFHPYLTQSEAMKLALLAFDKDVDSLSCCAT